MKLFAGLEANGLSGSDGDFRPSSGVAADACLSWFNSEDTEAAEFNAIARDKGLLHAFEDGIHRGLCFGTRQAGAFNNPLYKILLNHLGRRPWAVIFFETGY